jgi:hypothetical protein
MTPGAPSRELVAELLSEAPFRSNEIHLRDRWLIEHAYAAGAWDATHRAEEQAGE